VSAQLVPVEPLATFLETLEREHGSLTAAAATLDLDSRNLSRLRQQQRVSLYTADVVLTRDGRFSVHDLWPQEASL
jgi:hypothetical protein